MSLRSYVAYTALVLTVLISIYVMLEEPSREWVLTVLETHPVRGAFVFSSLMFFGTVFAPLTTLPLIPLATPFFGPLITALLAIVGWTLGAMVAFLIARYGARPLLKHFTDIDTLGRYESMVPTEAHFMLIVMLRMVIPVDILSYALGLLSTVSFRVYVSATLVGILWFAFAFAYMGEALFTHNYVLLAITGVPSVIVFLFAWSYVKAQTKRNRE